MDTTDGIAGEDWERVGELAWSLVAATLDEDDAACGEATIRLFAYLDTLDARYGERPSLLATRADFLDVDTHGRLKDALLRRAYALAEARDDAWNLLYVAHSLAELHIETAREPAEGRRWLGRLRHHAIRADDGWFAEEHARLIERLVEPGSADS